MFSKYSFIQISKKHHIPHSKKISIPYTRHHKPLLIRSCSWIQAIHEDRMFWKNFLKNKEMVFEIAVKNIQAAAYNGTRTAETGHFSIMKKLWDLKKVLSYMELEGHGRGIITEVTRPLLLRLFYYVKWPKGPNISVPSV